MTTIYLGFNALMYAVLSAWCVLAPKTTSAFVGLTTTGPAGESEYMAVYGGLQAGLALFYGVAVFDPAHRRTALLFSVLLYAGIAALRTGAVVRLGFGQIGNARFFYVLEVALFVAALVLVLRDRS